MATAGLKAAPDPACRVAPFAAALIRERRPILRDRIESGQASVMGLLRTAQQNLAFSPPD